MEASLPNSLRAPRLTPLRVMLTLANLGVNSPAPCAHRGLLNSRNLLIFYFGVCGVLSKEVYSGLNESVIFYSGEYALKATGEISLVR